MKGADRASGADNHWRIYRPLFTFPQNTQTQVHTTGLSISDGATFIGAELKLSFNKAELRLKVPQETHDTTYSADGYHKTNVP